MKLIIDIPEEVLEEIQVKFLNTKVNKISVTDKAIYNGTPLDGVKAEIEKLNPVDYGSMFSYESHNGAKDMQRDVLQILDNIGKAENEDKE